MTMNKFMADVDDLIFDGQEQSHSDGILLIPEYTIDCVTGIF